jgi:hypothetical protein
VNETVNCLALSFVDKNLIRLLLCKALEIQKIIMQVIVQRLLLCKALEIKKKCRLLCRAIRTRVWTGNPIKTSFSRMELKEEVKHFNRASTLKLQRLLLCRALKIQKKNAGYCAEQ